MEPEVLMEEVQEKAFMYQVPYIDVSSKTNEQIDNLFEVAIRKILENLKIEPKKKGSS